MMEKFKVGDQVVVWRGSRDEAVGVVTGFGKIKPYDGWLSVDGVGLIHPRYARALAARGDK